MKEWKSKIKFEMKKIKEKKLSEIPLPCIAQRKYDGELTFLYYDSSLAKWVTVNSWGHYRTDYEITRQAEILFEHKKAKVFIGELCAGKNLYDFLRSKKQPDELFLEIFDILPSPSERARTYEERYKEFENLHRISEKSLFTVNTSVRLVRIPYIICYNSYRLEAFFNLIVKVFEFEGIVCREQNGVGIWKVKKQRTVDTIIMGISKKGKHYPKQEVGSLLLGLYDNKGKLRKVGKVGSGFTEVERRRLFKALIKGKLSEDSKYIYVKPKIVIEITFNMLVKSKVYDIPKTFRSSRFIRFRIDKPSKDCKLSHQLPEVKT